MKRRPSILIVEPRQNMRTFLEMTFAQEGISVFSAVNFDSALLQLRVLHPDLIIIGAGQHREDENVVLAQIKALSASPLLALGDDSGEAPRPGVTEVLPYPYHVEQLCAKVAQLLDGENEPYRGRFGLNAGAANTRM